jgi:Mn-dependent DtxR family transcriptional regulator
MPGSGQSTAAKRNEPDLLTAGSEVTAVEEQEHTRQAKEPKLSDAMMNYLALMVQMEAAGIRLRSIDIANRMGVKKPSVCNALEKLAENGCVISCNGRDIVLTQKGRDLGAIFWEKTRILSGMLEAGGMEEKTAKEQAQRLAHAVSTDALHALLRVAGEPLRMDPDTGGQT